MRSSTAFFVYVCSAAALVTAFPTSQSYVKMLTKASARYPDGAVYCESSHRLAERCGLTSDAVITNDPNENMVVTASISSDGTLVRIYAPSQVSTLQLTLRYRGLIGRSLQVGVVSTDRLQTATRAQTASSLKALCRFQPGTGCLRRST